MKLKFGKVLPEKLLFDKSNILREEKEAMDSGTLPEKLLPFNIRTLSSKALPMLLGSSP
jgi:hypothetical protein